MTLKRKTPLKRKKTTEKKVKTRKTDYVKKLDEVFSKYIRLKYAMPNGYCKCISCNTIKPWNDGIQNGHYMSRRYMSTRFSEDNCRPQCVACNIFNQGNAPMFRQALVKQLGEQRVTLVEYRARNEVKKYSDFELKALIDYYTKQVEEIRKEKGI